MISLIETISNATTLGLTIESVAFFYLFPSFLTQKL